MSKHKTPKTNALRLLEQHKVSFELLEYEVNNGEFNGVTNEDRPHYPIERVFKTLVTTAGPGKLYIFVIPIGKELNLKTAAKVAGEKKVEMLHLKDLLQYTGYVRGGCSPVGMIKLYPTFIDNEALQMGKIVVSAGKVGLHMMVSATDLASVVKADFQTITM